LPFFLPFFLRNYTSTTKLTCGIYWYTPAAPQQPRPSLEKKNHLPNHGLIIPSYHIHRNLNLNLNLDLKEKKVKKKVKKKEKEKKPCRPLKTKKSPS
jgi:hypothetical protein